MQLFRPSFTRHRFDPNTANPTKSRVGPHSSIPRVRTPHFSALSYCVLQKPQHLYTTRYKNSTRLARLTLHNSIQYHNIFHIIVRTPTYTYNICKYKCRETRFDILRTQWRCPHIEMLSSLRIKKVKFFTCVFAFYITHCFADTLTRSFIYVL